MQSPLLSVIIPIFNTEDYLAQCLDSVIGQHFQDWELLLINDGSTDNSLAICQKYAASDSRVHVITTENRGQGAARNVGLGVAKGQFITFLDSDDCITNDTYSSNIAFLVEHPNIDFVQYPNAILTKEGVSSKKVPSETLILDDEESIFSSWYISKISSSVCWKIFRRNLLNDVVFSVEKCAEDHFFMMEILKKVNACALTTVGLYYYRCRPNSTCTNQSLKLQLDFLEVQVAKQLQAYGFKSLESHWWEYFNRIETMYFQLMYKYSPRIICKQTISLKHLVPPLSATNYAPNKMRARYWRFIIATCPVRISYWIFIIAFFYNHKKAAVERLKPTIW